MIWVLSWIKYDGVMLLSFNCTITFIWIRSWWIDILGWEPFHEVKRSLSNPDISHPRRVMEAVLLIYHLWRRPQRTQYHVVTSVLCCLNLVKCSQPKPYCNLHSSADWKPVLISSRYSEVHIHVPSLFDYIL